MEKDIMVSVNIITYNQEKTIKQAIDSVVMQETSFNFEVLIGNDCSTDSTALVIEKSLKKYKKNNDKYEFVNPGGGKTIIRVYNNKENKGATKNGHSIRMLSQGKYIAFLEGDDYWIDKNKLQKQFDFLEKNTEYAGVAHDQNVVNLDDEFVRKYSDWARNYIETYTFKDVGKGIMSFQFNSLMCRNYFKDYDTSFIYKTDNLVGDRLLLAYITSFGNIYILDDVMSAYRFDEKKWKSPNIYDSTIKSINYYRKFEKIEFPNKGCINFQNYINRLIADCYLNSFIRHQKLSRREKKNINSNTKTPVFLLILKRVFSYIFGIIKRTIRKPFRKLKKM